MLEIHNNKIYWNRDSCHLALPKDKKGFIAWLERASLCILLNSKDVTLHRYKQYKIYRKVSIVLTHEETVQSAEDFISIPEYKLVSFIEELKKAIC